MKSGMKEASISFSEESGISLRNKIECEANQIFE